MNRIFMLSIFPVPRFFKSCGLSCFLPQLTSGVSTQHAFICRDGSSGRAGRLTISVDDFEKCSRVFEYRGRLLGLNFLPSRVLTEIRFI